MMQGNELLLSVLCVVPIFVIAFYYKDRSFTKNDFVLCGVVLLLTAWFAVQLQYSFWETMKIAPSYDPGAGILFAIAFVFLSSMTLLVVATLRSEIWIQKNKEALFKSAQDLGIRCRSMLYLPSLSHLPYPQDCPYCHGAIVLPLTREMRRCFGSDYAIFNNQMDLREENALFEKLGKEKARAFCAGCGKEYNMEGRFYGMDTNGEVPGGLNLLEVLAEIRVQKN